MVKMVWYRQMRVRMELSVRDVVEFEASRYNMRSIQVQYASKTGNSLR
jgi:hypothetical protein